LSRAAGIHLPFTDATREKIFMENVNGVDPKKKIMDDTRNNWVTMMFTTKKGYNCFGKQSHIDTCTQAFRDLERFGFEFGDLGFTMNHVHYFVNIPKRYFFFQNAENIFKSNSAKKMVENSLDFGSDTFLDHTGANTTVISR